MGELSSRERSEVEQHLQDYPELKQELDEVERTLEALAMAASITPRAELKQNILAMVPDEKQTRVVALNRSMGYWRLAAAASVVLGLVASYFAYDYRNKWLTTTLAMNELIDRNQQIAENYNTVNQKLDKIHQDFSIIENVAFTKVILKGTANAPDAITSVYWNASTQEAYLSIQHLKEISQENQFQLWALVDGTPVDLGVFDSNFNGLLKMKGIQRAQAFAITIEPKGGKPTPTMETMQVFGEVAKV